MSLTAVAQDRGSPSILATQSNHVVQRCFRCMTIMTGPDTNSDDMKREAEGSAAVPALFVVPSNHGFAGGQLIGSPVLAVFLAPASAKAAATPTVPPPPRLCAAHLCKHHCADPLSIHHVPWNIQHTKPFTVGARQRCFVRFDVACQQFTGARLAWPLLTA